MALPSLSSKFTNVSEIPSHPLRDCNGKLAIPLPCTKFLKRNSKVDDTYGSYGLATATDGPNSAIVFDMGAFMESRHVIIQSYLLF